ncbi:NAD-dependent epimerase/dehydratase family protein, partial [Aduncisulcus paluster]
MSIDNPNPTAKMDVFITGGAGFVGSRIVNALISRGHRVTYITNLLCVKHALNRFMERSKERSPTFYSPQFISESIDPESMTSEPPKTCIIHAACVSSWKDLTSPKLWKTAVSGTENVIKVAKSIGVDKFVYISSAAAVDGCVKGDRIATESSSFSPKDPKLLYSFAKIEAEKIVFSHSTPSFSVSIACPSEVYGSYDYNGITCCNLIGFLTDSPALTLRGGSGFVHVCDVAVGVVRICESGKNCERYILTGTKSNASIKRLGEVSLELAHRRTPLIKVPFFIVKAFTKLCAWMDIRPPIEDATLPFAYYYWYVSGDKAAKQLGFHGRELKDTLRDCIAWMRADGCNASIKRLGEVSLELAHRRTPLIKVPFFIVKAFTKLCAWMDIRPPIEDATLPFAYYYWYVSGDKAAKQLGFHGRELKDTLRDSVACFSVSDAISAFSDVTSFLTDIADTAAPIETYENLLTSLNASSFSIYSKEYESNSLFADYFIDQFYEGTSDAMTLLRLMHSDLCNILDAMQNNSDISLPDGLYDEMNHNFLKPVPDEYLSDTTDNPKYSTDNDKVQISWDQFSEISTGTTFTSDILRDAVTKYSQPSSYYPEEERYGLEWSSFFDYFHSPGDLETSSLSWLRVVSAGGVTFVTPGLYYGDPSLETIPLKERIPHDGRHSHPFNNTTNMHLRRGSVILLDLSMDAPTKAIMNSPMGPYILTSFISEAIGVLHSLSYYAYISIVSTDGAWAGFPYYSGSDASDTCDS